MSRRGRLWAKSWSLWGPAQGTCRLGAMGMRLQPSPAPLTARPGPASARGPQLGPWLLAPRFPALFA